MNATFRVLLTIEVVAHHTHEFEQQWAAGDHIISSQSANRGHWLGKSDSADHEYFVISDWVDETGFRAFEQSAEHLQHRREMRPFLAGGSMATMRLIPTPTSGSISA